jgi:hypothetical protein
MVKTDLKQCNHITRQVSISRPIDSNLHYIDNATRAKIDILVASISPTHHISGRI